MENIIYERSTEKPYLKAVEDLIESLGKNQFGVLWQLNVKEKLKEKGVDFDHNMMILEVCNPNKAKEALETNRKVVYFLPCKVVVTQREDQVIIGMLKPELIFKLLEEPLLESTAMEVQNTIIKSIDEAVL